MAWDDFRFDVTAPAPGVPLAVMLPSMLRAGYPKPFTAALIAAAGSTDILIPPSIAFIIYSLLVPQASVPALFAAGLIPGILSGLTLIAMTGTMLVVTFVPEIALWLPRVLGYVE